MDTFKQYISESFEVGDRISWWFNKYHPRYPGRIIRISGNKYIVKAEGSGDTYTLEKYQINQFGKPS